MDRRTHRRLAARRGGLLIVAMMLVVASCGGDSTADSSTDTTAAPTTTTAAPTTTTEASDVLAPLADGFPDHQLTLWNAFEPGHTDDLFNVIVADIARKYSPVPIVTASQPSGSRLQYGLVRFLRGQAGSEDGYQIYAVSWFGGTLRPYTVEALADAELTDLQPINSMLQAPFVALVPLDSPFETLTDVAEFARANPGELTVVGSGAGSGLHSTALVWADQEGIEFRFIPTDGAGESRNVLAGGGAQLGFVTFQPGLDQTFKILAVTGDQRVSIWPDVPTTSELGFKVPAGSFRGVGTVPGIPDEHLQWINNLLEKVFNDPAFGEQMPGFELIYTGPAEMAELRQSIVDTFVPVLETAGFTISR